MHRTVSVLLLLAGCTTLDLEPTVGGDTNSECAESETPTSLDDARMGQSLQQAIDATTGLSWAATWAEDDSATTVELTLAVTGEPFVRLCDGEDQFVEVPASGSLSTANGVFDGEVFLGEMVVYADGGRIFKAELMDPTGLDIDWSQIYVVEGPGTITTAWLRLEVEADRLTVDASGMWESGNSTGAVQGTVLTAAP